MSTTAPEPQPSDVPDVDRPDVQPGRPETDQPQRGDEPKRA